MEKMVISNDQLEPSAEPLLLSRAQAGEAEAFSCLIIPLQVRLLRQATLLCSDPAAAEDLVAETIVEAWKSIDRFNGSCRLSTWIYSILLHRHYKALRRARSRPLSLAWLPFFRAEALQGQHAELPSPAPLPDESMAQKELSHRVQQCLAALPQKHREVILLRFFEEASLPDIAAVLNCSVGTVKSRLHHALDKLRKMKMNLSEIERDTSV